MSGIEKTALFGWSRPAPPPPPTIWKKMGERVVGPVMGFAAPGLMAFGTANSIASGEQSLGEGLGELGGGLAGWSLGAKGFNSLAKNMKPGKLKTALSFASGFLGSGIGASIGAGMGHAVMPFQRKPKNFQDYWQTGWNGQPDAY